MDCKICFEKKNSMKKLTCGHSTCTECWDDWESVCNQVTCPFCRYQIPKSAIDRFLDIMFDVMEVLSEYNEIMY